MIFTQPCLSIHQNKRLWVITLTPTLKSLERTFWKIKMFSAKPVTISIVWPSFHKFGSSLWSNNLQNAIFLNLSCILSFRNSNEHLKQQIIFHTLSPQQNMISQKSLSYWGLVLYVKFLPEASFYCQAINL